MDHMKAMHQEINESEMFKCEFCFKLFKVKNYFLTHLRRVHGKSNKRLLPKKEKKIRIKSNRPKLGDKTEKQVHHCDPCKKIFTTRKSYQNHKTVKHDFKDPEKMYICDHCGKRQILKYYLIRHIQVVHFKIPTKRKNVPVAVPCEVCGKIVKDRSVYSFSI